MKYRKEILEEAIAPLLGQKIVNIFYYTEYEGYEVYQQLSTDITEVPCLGILIETSSNQFYNIISYDYSPYYLLGGIRVFRDNDFKTPQGRPNQINTTFWDRYRFKEISNVVVIENYYKKGKEEISIPFGIKLIFEDEECYILNLIIEGFIQDNQSYDFSRGGELVLFSGKNTLDKYSILKESTFHIA